MNSPNNSWDFKRLLKTIGPGLLFAGSAIGTSHLVLSTRAGAHHGMIVFWFILGALIFKYPFFQYGPRYANATGYSLLKGYKDQGQWAVILFMLVIFINMFAVTGAVSAVCAGLLSTMLGAGSIPTPYLVGGTLIFTAGLLLIGRYMFLDYLIKIISIVLLFTVGLAFFAVLFKGPIDAVEGFETTSLWEGTGLALMISLIGWMPTGIEVSTMHSIWAVEKMKVEKYKPSLKESLFDFNLGYLFTTILAILFLVIGAFTSYGSGKSLSGKATAFSNELLNIFTTNLGDWSYFIIAIAAFGTIYGTLITAWDAFSRSFIRGLRTFKFGLIDNNSEEQEVFLRKGYNIALPLIGFGGFALFYFSSASMIKMIELATITAFITAPVIAALNLRTIQSKEVPKSHQPSKSMVWFSYLGIFLMLAFSTYYLIYGL